MTCSGLGVAEVQTIVHKYLDTHNPRQMANLKYFMDTAQECADAKEGYARKQMVDAKPGYWKRRMCSDEDINMAERVNRIREARGLCMMEPVTPLEMLRARKREIQAPPRWAAWYYQPDGSMVFPPDTPAKLIRGTYGGLWW